MMAQETIYRELWCKGDDFAKKIAEDSAISPVLRAVGLFIIREYGKAKSLIENNLEITPDDMVYQELKLYFDLSNDKSADLSQYRQRAEALIGNAPWLIYTHLLLGNILEQQKDFEDADKHYEEVFESCPNNVVAIAGVIRILIRKHEFGQALLVLQARSKSALGGLNPIKRRDWRLIFLVYRLFSYWGERVILRFVFGLLILLSAFLSPVCWIVPGVLFLLFLGFSIYLFQKDSFAFSMSFTTALYVPAFWLLGLLLKFIIHFILFVITGS